MPHDSSSIRNLCLILGDQLNHDSEIWSGFDPDKDLIAFFEVEEESVTQLSSKQRTTLFFSAMRHFAEELRNKKLPVHYSTIDEKKNSFSTTLLELIHKCKPEQLRVVLPGDSRILDELKKLSAQLTITLDVLPDNHFISLSGQFSQWLGKLKQPRMEYWYRFLRKEHHLLLDDAGKPLGGKWNFDQENRKKFSSSGPSHKGLQPTFPADEITRNVIADVKTHLPNLPGNLEYFIWPVSRNDALKALDHFIEERLPLFGDYQDAMWTNEPFLYHAWLSSSLNLKLLSPSEVISKAIVAFESGKAPLNAVEGFVRQVLGWREYVRGLYWTYHDSWGAMNELEHNNKLPSFYWTADTEMKCLQQSISQVLNYGYGHHIQRLMVTGLFALLSKVDPQEVHRWYLAMYVDAVAWVEVPNTIGMSQFADGGIFASKPYIASGNYINRMSNYCTQCPFSPDKATGENACPFTTLYWAFIHDNENWLVKNPRLAMQVKHWNRKSPEDQKAILLNRKKLISLLHIEAD
ncbi:cryptochrome/photolyase family protein [Neptuniibacter sp.]|uniref:cryptochrome/photolyase family protein n=1 Tax=Neptuniibacter sp. TaxID=1962643 RepID=UPI0026209FC4|nr:cryptochrome/photolyase family protein [Neptuniibacter sp.]MCP4596282.1 cryptochrome/photolyase family protein [Neptuniibacter sp.]